ncbi:MAG: tetratricopeptide repeat protein [Marivibrio sp.]|uniref:hypothetical protein n=1 Tax=Marivibrio sp. TaxID=2039719 RepID=UPI0032EF7A74
MTNRSQAALIGLALTSLAAEPPPAAAQEIETLQAREYKACMSLINVDPDQAFEAALQLQDRGGGAPAKHCAAAALAAAGHHEEAATRFEALAVEMPDSATPAIVADILGHAGLAWLNAGAPGKAYTVQTAALDLAPESPDILIDRAVALADLNRLWEAIDDLDRALEFDSTRVDALTLRASAYRQLEVLDLAMESANRALDLDPDNPEALLERGAVHRLAGDLDAARADWIRLIEKHDGRPAAEMARRNLDSLDFGPPTGSESPEAPVEN